MSFAPGSPVTGGAQTGFTSPTYTLTADTAPSANGKQYAVTAIGGTQTGVDTHSVSKPFTVTMFRPVQLRALPAANPVTGIVKNVPVNTYKIVVRKGAVPLVNQAATIASVTVTINVPAGTDTYEPEDIKALLSCTIGVLNSTSAGIGDTVLTGIL